MRCVCFGMAVPFWSSSLAVARHLPHGRSPGGDRHLNFYGDRDNLGPIRRTWQATRTAFLPEPLPTHPRMQQKTLLSFLQDLLGLWVGESHAHPGRAYLPLRGLWAGR